ncbi:MAG TPA: DUF721 domain-containing protein [Coxiellaceae bacterium]|nr:DUF721 domain-containing protein [Coxiellaceae bacterium]
MQTLYRKPTLPPDTVQSMTDVFQGSLLTSIIQKARLLTMLDEHLKNILPPELAAHVRVMNVASRTLILSTHSAAIATRIQMMTGQLVEKIRKNPLFLHIQIIQCRIRVETN